jgi:putative transposase
VAFIDEHVDARRGDADGPGLRWGVESICEQLTALGCKIAPATYYEHRPALQPRGSYAMRR